MDGFKKIFTAVNQKTSDYNGNRTNNHLVRKWTLNHSVKLPELLSCVVSTYLYGAFESDCIRLNFRYRACF